MFTFPFFKWEIPFLGKRDSKIENYYFKVKFGFNGDAWFFVVD